LTPPAILCSLALGRVKLATQPVDDRARAEENPVAPVPVVDRNREPAQPSLDPLFRLLQGDLDRVNALIVERMASPVALIPQLAGHIVSAGGKRLRPMLTLGCARLCGYHGDRHIALAAAVEFIHTATLLHDDVVDASGLRRGRDTANAVWGNKPAVLVGDFLFARAFQLMVDDGSLRILDILSRTAAVIAEGEVHQLITANDTATTEAAYLEVIEAKTAALFAAASRIGAVLAERPASEEEALAGFGRNLGIAYQLVDDMLDFAARPTEFGKSVGDDFRDGKITLPIVIAFSRGDAEERGFWRRTLEQGEQNPGDLERAMRLLERHGALAETLARARLYAAAAVEALAVFPDGPLRRALAETAAFATARGF
jgi:octaprenyl-diphosphate synthase